MSFGKMQVEFCLTECLFNSVAGSKPPQCWFEDIQKSCNRLCICWTTKELSLTPVNEILVLQSVWLLIHDQHTADPPRLL